MNVIRILEETQRQSGLNNIIDDYNRYVTYINESELEDNEKETAQGVLDLLFDLLNIRSKKVMIECLVCHSFGYAKLACQTCVEKYLRTQFDNWTSGNDEIDREIREAQIELSYPQLMTEWINIEDMEDLGYINRGSFSAVYTATWIKGPICGFDVNQKKFIRSGAVSVILRQVPREFFHKEIGIHFKAKKFTYGIVPCYGITRYNDEYMLVLKKMVKNLEDYFKEKSTMSREQIYDFLWALSSSLGYLHKFDIIHKDIHPKNIMMDETGKWMLIDLGLSGITREDIGRKGYGDVMYADPEITQKDGRHSKETDIFSIGAIMIFVETGKLPEV